MVKMSKMKKLLGFSDICGIFYTRIAILLLFQVRLVFALFGGVGAVRFVVDPKTGQRMAYVELKNRENMAKACGCQWLETSRRSGCCMIVVWFSGFLWFLLKFQNAKDELWIVYHALGLGKWSQAVEQLHNTKVGDGELIEDPGFLSRHL